MPLRAMLDKPFGKTGAGQEMKMDIAAQHGVDPISLRWAVISARNRRHWIDGGIAEFVASRPVAGVQPELISCRFRLQVTQRGAARLHPGPCGKESGHWILMTV